MEGMTPQIILSALRRAGATMDGEAVTTQSQITKQDMMELGLSGGKDSSSLRGMLLRKLDLPEHMSANAMLQALNLLYSKEEISQLVVNLKSSFTE